MKSLLKKSLISSYANSILVAKKPYSVNPCVNVKKFLQTVIKTVLNRMAQKKRHWSMARHCVTMLDWLRNRIA